MARDSISGNNAGITAYTYDLLNRATHLTQSGTGVQSKRVDMAYNAVNQMISLKRFSGNTAVAETSSVYDNNQRLIKLSHQKGANTIASYDYTFDDADKLSKTASSVDGTSNYSYDATNQLTGATHDNQADEAYQYDANGNRTNSGYQTGANNQLLKDGTFTYEYDAEGNRTRRVETATGKVTEYVWDYRNRLTSVLFKDSGGAVSKTIDYLYDRDNQRIGKQVDGAVTERYVLDRNQIALVFDGQGNQTHRYLYGTEIDQVLADEAPTRTLWALSDNQGTIRDLIDNGGSLDEHLTYDSFGKVISTPINDFRYGYTGREQDAETGLDYYRARYYDASVGRFISEDPIGFSAGDGNLTRYVGNNAVNAIDPSGLELVLPSYGDFESKVMPVLKTLPGVGTTIGIADYFLSPLNPCITECIAKNLGLTLTGTTALGSGLPIIPTRSKTLGTTPGTSPASSILSKAFPQRPLEKTGYRFPAPTFARPFAKTAVLGRAIGRWVPIVGVGILFVDAALITKCTIECKNTKKEEKVSSVCADSKA